MHKKHLGISNNKMNLTLDLRTPNGFELLGRRETLKTIGMSLDEGGWYSQVPSVINFNKWKKINFDS